MKDVKSYDIVKHIITGEKAAYIQPHPNDKTAFIAEHADGQLTWENVNSWTRVPRLVTRYLLTNSVGQTGGHYSNLPEAEIRLATSEGTYNQIIEIEVAV